MVAFLGEAVISLSFFAGGNLTNHPQYVIMYYIRYIVMYYIR